MQITKTNIKNILEDSYQNITPLLEPKDGFQHVLLLNDNIASVKTVTSYGNAEYTLYLNNILKNLQNDGYELIDIKVSCIEFAGITFQSLIIYK